MRVLRAVLIIVALVAFWVALKAEGSARVPAPAEAHAVVRTG